MTDELLMNGPPRRKQRKYKGYDINKTKKFP
jgi:hypothetical protein